MTSISGLCGVLRIHVQILKQASLRESGFIVDSRAPVTMTAGSNLKIKRAIDSGMVKNGGIREVF